MEQIATFPPRRMRPADSHDGDTCATCRFWQPSDGADGIDPANLKAPPSGFCRRYPPTPQILGQRPIPGAPAGMMAPVVGRAMTQAFGPEWCGEHKPKIA